MIQPQLLKKEVEVVVSLPKLKKGQTYENVFFEEVYKPTTELQIKMKNLDDNLWFANVYVPVSKNVKYRFKAEVLSRGYIKNSHFVMESLVHQMQESETVREFFDQEHTNSHDVFSHLKDVLTRQSIKQPLAECVVHIEMLCKVIYMNLADCQAEYQMLMDKIDRKSGKQLILGLVLFGRLFYNNYDKARKMLSHELCQSILKSLTEFRSTDLASSCTLNLFSVVDQLCREAERDDYCFLSSISYAYPFFDEAYLYSRISEILIRRQPLVSESVSDKTAKRILILLVQIWQTIEYEKAKKFLQQIVLNVPLKMAVKLYLEFEQNISVSCASSDGQAVIYAALLESVIFYLSSRKRSAEDLKSILELLNKIPNLVVSAKQHMENAVVKAISDCTITNFQTEELKTVILSKNIFVTEESQLILIKGLTSVGLPSCHFLMFDLLMDEKFREASLKTENVWFHECFENAIKHIIKRENKGEERLERIYSYLSKAHDMCTLRNLETPSSYIDKFGIEFLKENDTRKLMILAKLVEKLAEKRPGLDDLFSKHIQVILNERNESDYYDILIVLCERNNRLHIDSSVAASIVTTVINNCSPKSEGLLEEFKDLSRQCKLWKAVFQATGQNVKEVRETKTVQKIRHITADMLKMLYDKELPFSYLEGVTNKTSKDDVTALLTLESSGVASDINKIWDQIIRCFQTELDTINTCNKVLRQIQIKMPLEIVQSSTKTLIMRLNGLKRDIEQGKVRASQLLNGDALWNDLQNLREKCVFLDAYLISTIFWNSCSSAVSSSFKEEYQILLEKKREMQTVDSYQDYDVLNLLLEIFNGKGLSCYLQAWTSLQVEHEKDVSFALELLNNVNVADEIRYAEENFRKPVPQDIKKTLHRLKQIDTYDHIVDLVCKVLEVFGVKRESSKDVHEAIVTFENLKEKSVTCSFSAVVKSLQKLDYFAKELLPETIDLLSILSASSTLIEFLREILDEDIRNLIDAVEDISEQHVQESTVSALIEVKSFLHQLLAKTPEHLNAKEFLDLINMQTKTSSTSKIPAKIDECMHSLHSLKSLYGNVANRGAVTSEIIDNIISQGNFNFEINKEGFCDFYTTYKYRTVHEKQSKNTLIDLRSRALLLMNSTKVYDRKTSSHNLENFVLCIDLSTEISNLLDDLHHSGNMSFITYNYSKSCQDLAELQEYLYQKYNEWDEVLHKLREEFYLLNFIHGPEIHLLYNCFEHNLGRKKVVSLLRFIHPELTLQSLRGVYTALKRDEKSLTDEETMRLFGKMLHDGYAGKQPLQRPLVLKSQSKHLTEVVQNRKLFVASSEERSSQVVKILLSLYMHTTQTFPEPHQVLFCSKDTTWNELELLLCRCFGSFKFTKVRQLFCIANVELLPNELQFKLVEKLKSIETNENFLLSVICTGSGTHQFLDELSSASYKSSAMLSDEQMRHAFQAECSAVVTYTSTVPGLGKTSTIKQKAFISQKELVKLHLSGPLNKSTIVEKLSATELHDGIALHIDIGSVENVIELDTFIFELIILKHVSASFRSCSLTTGCVFIEVANTINDTLRNSLNTVMAFKRKHLNWENYDNFYVSMENNSPIQVVCQYLDHLEKNTLDNKDLQFGLHSSTGSLSPNYCRNLLRKHFGTGDSVSFSVVNMFLNVLAEQLKKMSCSLFFRVSRIRDMIGHKTTPNVRSTLVKALLEASKEFSSRSIKSCRSTQASTLGASDSSERETSTLSCNSSLAEMSKQRVEGMVRWEDSNHLIFVFHSQNVQTISPMYRHLEMVSSHIRLLFESQMKREMKNFSCMSQDELRSLLQKVARNSPLPMNDSIVKKLNAEYALTPDNLLKMVLIMLRVKSNIAVLVMGETGCGKTSLIRYLATISDVDFEVLSIHAGVEESKILQTIENSNELAFATLEKERWLFLDEINTSEHIGVMTDAICGRTCLGKALAPNLVVMGACNPYKLRSGSAISTAGLKEKVKTDELSKLVYRVLPLPERLVDYVWDFGTLSDTDEAIYIKRMIEDLFPADTSTLNLLQELLSVSQKFVRQQESASYCVSLRDIQRCKTLIRWFIEILPKQHGQVDNLEIEAIVLSLAICYHSRFSSNNQRVMYRTELQTVFKKYNRGDVTVESINRRIIEEQKDILRRMELPPGTAKNTALLENVFVILVCLLNKIPIFLVGKPGCSKSLAMQVIRSNLRGKDSKNDFFTRLPQLYCVSFQGSESSTSDGIIKVFEKATRYQETNNPDEVLSVVILDEIGLAEVSRFNPLKVLHSLLEPDGRLQPDVAVVGISNWALDASKMNRAIHLSRPDMDEEELFQTGVSISESFIESKQSQMQSRFGHYLKLELNDNSKGMLKHIAAAYLKYVNERLLIKNFHGLRDYYSLVKFISRGILADGMSFAEIEKDAIVFKGLQRNFGGLPADRNILFNVFQIQANRSDLQATTTLKLLEENIADQLARHLMCITSGDSGLDLLESLLTNMNRQEKVIIFGSQFEEDQTADYNYRILSRIILCMEQGFVLILKDLENIYGSLYDMLNQNYTVIGKKKHCRVALGHYSNPICHVHDSFRCIVLVDESKLNYADPPFLNRFEKQNLRFSDTVDKHKEELIEQLNSWTKQFSEEESGVFDESDCFSIFSQEIIPSLVLKMYQGNCEGDTQEDMFEKCKSQLLYIVQSDAVFRLGTNKSKEMRKNAKLIKEEFLQLPIHSGIWHLLDYQFSNIKDDTNGLLTIVLTNTSIHSQDMLRNKKYDVQVEKLGAFKSEKQLHLRLQHFWKEATETVLFLHCSAAEDAKHISLVKATIENIRSEVLREKHLIKKHVYLIIHLDRRRAESKVMLPVTFLSGWEIVTLDAFTEPAIQLPELSSLSLIEAVKKKIPLTNYITEQLFWSFSRIRYESYGRDLHSIQSVIEKIEASEEFLDLMEKHVLDWVNNDFTGSETTEWVTNIAVNPYHINNSSSFLVALDEEVLRVIQEPISKLIYQMENMNVITSFFCDDGCQDRNETLEKMLNDETFFSIAGVHKESGPECYPCTAIDLPLRMPFSKLVFDKTEELKEKFMERYYKVKENYGLDEDDQLDDDILEQLFSEHEGMVDQSLPDMAKYVYPSLYDDYYHDFCYLVSYSTPSKLLPERKHQITRWCLEQELKTQTSTLTELIVKLHATYWIYTSVMVAEHMLFETCSEIFNNDENFVQFFGCSHVDSQQATEDSDGIPVVGSTSSHVLETTGPLIIDGCSSDERTDVEESLTANDRDDITAGSSLNKNDINPSESRKGLVQFVCRKLLPSQKTLDIFGTIEVWKNRASTVLMHAVKISSDPMVLHALRFFVDLTSILNQSLLAIKQDHILVLGNMLQIEGDTSLDSQECFDCIRDIVSAEPSISCRDAKNIYASYLNRCLATDHNSEAMIRFLQLPFDEGFMDNNFDILKAPLEISVLQSEVDFVGLLNRDTDTILEENRFVHELDTTLKRHEGTVCADSQFAVLVVDILEEQFTQNIKAQLDGDLDEMKMVLFNVQDTIYTCSYGLKFLSAIAFYKSLINYYAEEIKRNSFDVSKLTVLLPVVKELLDKESERPISLAIKQYFVKAIGQGLFPWSLYKVCERLAESFDFLKSWQWSDNYLFQSIEGNPLFQCVPTNAKLLLEVMDEKDPTKRQTRFQSYLKINRDYTGLLALHAVSLSRFYIPRTYRQQNDTFTQLADVLVQDAKMEKMDANNANFLACILGVNSFKCFELNEYTDDVQTACAIFSSSMFAILLAYNHNLSDPKSFLSTFLLCPCKVTSAAMTSIRSLDKQKQKNGSEDNNKFWVSCTCGYRLFEKRNNSEDKIECPMCLRQISKSTYVSTKMEGKGKAVQNSVISNIVVKIVELCVKACLMGSVVLNISTEKDLEKITGMCEIDDIPKALKKEIENNFKDIQKTMGLNCRDMFIFLQACLLHVRGFLTDNTISISTEAHVCEWVCKLTHQLEPLIRDRYKTIVHAVEQQSLVLQNPCGGPELQVNENDIKSITSEERKRLLPSLFRVRGQETRTIFEYELDIIAERTEHPNPFLKLVMTVLPDLNLTEHILNIYRWHMGTLSQIECRMKKRKCLEMTVEEFLYIDGNENVRERLKDRFRSLQESLALLSQADKRFEVLNCNVTSQTKMKDCLILDDSSLLFAVMKELCEIQNAFLDSVLEICVSKKSCAIQFLSKCDGQSAVHISGIAEMKKSSIVAYRWNDELLKFSQADLKYGYGARIRYEFEAIEKLLALELVAGKPYIALKSTLPSVTFVDEFYKGFGQTVKEICGIIRQKPLPLEMVQKIKEKREQNPKLTVELITHIGVLIALVKKTQGESEMPLIEYVDKWKRVLGNSLPSKLLPTPENSLRLCHLIDLYGLLEELNADSLKDTLGTLGSDYKIPLSLDMQKKLKELLQTNQKLAEIILRATKRFVHRCVFTGDIDTTQFLAKYMADASFWPYDITSVKGNQVEPYGDDGRNVPVDALPKDLKVYNVAKLIAYLESELKELSEQNVKLREFATSFSPRRTPTKAQQIKQLTKRRL